MSHIHTAPGQYDHTVSAYIINRSTEKPTILLHMHKILGQLFQPGGHIELHETPWQALSHEIIEETGYDLNQLRVLQPTYVKNITLSDTTKTLHPVPFMVNSHPMSDKLGSTHNHTDSLFLLTTDETPANAPGENESEDLRWLTLEDIRNQPDGVVSSALQDTASVAFNIATSDEWLTLPFNHFQ